MSVAYANAREIIPPEFLEALQRHWEGGLLWVPLRTRRREKTQQDLERNRRIARDKARGVPTSVLARRYHLTPERIRQIVKGNQAPVWGRSWGRGAEPSHEAPLEHPNDDGACEVEGLRAALPSGLERGGSL